MRVKILVLLGVLTVGLCFYSAGYYVNKQINSLSVNFAEKISAEIGHPVTIGKISVKWDWLYLKATVTNLAIMNASNQIPVFMAKKIIGSVDIINSLLALDAKFKHLQFISPRLVVQLDGDNTPKILGFSSDDSTYVLDSSVFLKLLATQRSVGVEDGDVHIQGQGDADLPLMNIKLDFRKKSNTDYFMVVRGGIAAAAAPEFNFAMNYRGKLENYANAMVDFELKTSNMQVESFLKLIPPYKQKYTSGSFKDLDLKGTIQNGTVQYLSSNFSIDELTIAADNKIKHGTGNIEFKPNKNKLNFTLQDLQVENKNYFSKNIPIDSIVGEIIDNTAEVSIKSLDVEIKPVINFKLQDYTISSLSLDSEIKSENIKKVLDLLPDVLLGQELTAWLKQSFIAGEIVNTKLNYHPDNFTWQMDIKKVDLKYSPLWPSINGIDAILVLDSDKISIQTTQANILGNNIKYLAAKIVSNNNNPYSRTIINGSMDTTLDAGLKFLRLTPFNNSIAKQLDKLQLSGPAHLDLELDLNINKGNLMIATAGNLQLQNNILASQDFNLKLTNITGEMFFTNDQLKSNDIKLQLLGQPGTAKINLDAKKENVLNIIVAAPFKVPNLDHISGMTNILANLDLPLGDSKNDGVFTITSDLYGVAIDYPEPLFKPAKSKRKFKLKYIIQTNIEPTVYFNYADLLDANIIVKNGKFAGGHVSFGHDKALLAVADNLLISGKLHKFDWDAWQPLLQGKNKLATMPIEIDMLFDSINFHGDKYSDMWVKYDSTNNSIGLDSKIIKGTINFTKEEDKLDIKLDHLDLGTKTAKNSNLIKLIHEKNKLKKLPLIQFYAAQLKINNKNYKKVNIQLLPRVYGYEITNFTINTDNILLQTQGQWQLDNKEYTQLSGNLYIKDFGKGLNEGGLGNSITKGVGEINFSLEWDGDPANFGLANVNGNSHIELRSGSLTDVKPGLGRILGLLSLESIQRRLQLDFSDLTSKGFPFDKIESDIQFKSGIASTNNILISSPSAKIELAGKTNIKTQDLDFTMVVMPKINVGLPVAAAIAVANPAIGAAIWLFDQASSTKIGEMNKINYKVSGTWNAPKIVEVVEKKAP